MIIRSAVRVFVARRRAFGEETRFHGRVLCMRVLCVHVQYCRLREVGRVVSRSVRPRGGLE
jgi:hypothetical protein